VGALAACGAGSAAWLLRDPVPHFMARRGVVAAAETVVLTRDGAHANEQVRLRGSTGLAVELLLRRPVGPSADSSTPARRPLFVILGGYTTGQRAATLIDDTGGNIVVALSYPFDGNTRVKGLAVVPLVPRIRQAILDTPPAVMLALDYLLSRPDVDSTRVELVGASFGTPFATIAGALDQRVTRVWSVHGAGEPYTLMEHNLQKAVRWGPARAVVAGLANVLANGPGLAPEKWAPRVAPRPYLMINATEDERLPREAIMTLYDHAVQPKELIWLPGQHVQSNRAEVLQGLVRAVLTRAAQSL